MNNLIKKVQTFSNRFDLLEKDLKIVVGVSGGPDSVCLLDILSKLKNKYNLEILVAHINYGLRGSDSDKDEKVVEKLVAKYGFEIEILTVQNLKIAEINENELRNIRYNFFEKIRERNNFNIVAVAHNRDDQAETFLMRMLRGSGLQGMRSIRPKNEKIIRPLLRISREEILDYLKDTKLSYRIDKSNTDIRFFRNKIRQQLIPYLEKKYNPVIKKTLSDSVENIADDYDFIDAEAKKIQNEIVLIEKENEIDIDIFKFKKKHSAIQRQILRQLIFKIKGDLKDIQNTHIEEILKITKSAKNKRQLKMFVGLKIERKGGKLHMLIF